MTISSVGSSTTTTTTPETTTPSTKGGPGGPLGKHEFLKLLTAQLRHQDPMNPLQGDEMAAQLAQFASVEALTNIGDQLAGQQSQSTAVLTAINNSVAMGTIGKTVTAPGDKLNVPTDATVTALIGGAGKGTLQITDSAGKVVGTRDLGTVTAGVATFDVGNATKGLGSGAYRYKILVSDAKGQPVETTTFSKVKIDGVTYGQDGAMLTSGSLSIPITSVIRIEG
jgi:flagellar basal-body rod modification protein FlgD